MVKWLGGDKAIKKAFKEAATGSVDDALTLLRRAARISDPEGDRVDAMGAIHYQRGQWKEAAAAFEQSLSKQPGNRSRLLYFCSALSRAGEAERATALLEQEGRQSPNDVSPHAIRCIILAERSLYPEARSAYEAARQIFTLYPDQTHEAMGLMEQCGDLLAQFPKPAPN